MFDGNRDQFGSSQEPTLSPLKAALLGIIGAFFLYQIVGGLLTTAIIGLDTKNADVNVMRLLQMASQVLFILLPALVFARYIYFDATPILRIKRPDVTELILFILGIIVLSLLLYNYLALQTLLIDYLAERSEFVMGIKQSLDELEKMIEDIYSRMLSADNLLEGTLVVLTVAVTPAISEELMFRGYIQKSFELRYTPFKGALITAIVFGIFHFNPYSLIPLAALGLFFGYAAYKTDSIAVPVLLHFLNNLSVVLIFFVAGEDLSTGNSIPEEVPVGQLIISGLFLLTLFISLIIFINRFYKKRKQN